jgi:hypothetical protein
METEIARTESVHSGSELIRVFAELRVAAKASGMLCASASTTRTGGSPPRVRPEPAR